MLNGIYFTCRLSHLPSSSVCALDGEVPVPSSRSGQAAEPDHNIDTLLLHYHWTHTLSPLVRSVRK